MRRVAREVATSPSTVERHRRLGHRQLPRQLRDRMRAPAVRVERTGELHRSATELGGWGRGITDSY